MFQTCEKRVQKFRTDEANFQPIRHTSQIWVVTRHQHGMSALVQTSFRGASPWWRSEMSAVFSRYIQGYKWCCVDRIVFVSLSLLSRLMGATVEPRYNEGPRDWQIWFSIRRFRCIEFLFHSRLSLNRHLYKTDTSVKRTPRVGPCHSLLLLFDSL